MTAISSRMTRFADVNSAVLQFLTNSDYTRKAGEPGICDFAIGNPHEMPLPGLISALEYQLQPKTEEWYAYTMNESGAVQTVVQSLKDRYGLAIEPENVIMTTGGFSAISIAIHAVTDPGDEVIFNSPPWFFYEAMLQGAGCIPVRVKVRPDNFDLDLEAIRAAITPKTRAIIVNSPNNPTGKIYPPETLRALADILTEASARNGRIIYLFSDEAYRRILYDGVEYPSPIKYYVPTFMLYTYGKQTLAPGQRIGYIALPSAMPDVRSVALACLTAQLTVGFAQPNALLQHALADIEKTCLDLEHLQYKRDWMIRELRNIGYDVHLPEGTFYLLPRSPIPDDQQFIRLLAEQNVLCLPGELIEMPGYFRVSLTANDSMIERGLPGFKAAFEAARA